MSIIFTTSISNGSLYTKNNQDNIINSTIEIDENRRNELKT